MPTDADTESRPIHIAVYCSARTPASDSYVAAARDLGHAVAARGYTLVYGGGSSGLMLEVADAALSAGGEVIGVIPEELLARGLHPRLTQARVVPSLHARKATMSKLSDAAIALPGGYGTLDELFEALAWSQLGICRKPIGLLNVQGFFGDLLRFIDRAVDAGFLKPNERQLITRANDPEGLLRSLELSFPDRAASWEKG